MRQAYIEIQKTWKNKSYTKIKLILYKDILKEIHEFYAMVLSNNLKMCHKDKNMWSYNYQFLCKCDDFNI